MLGPCFSHLIREFPAEFVKCRCWLSRSHWGLGFCISVRLLADTNTAGPRTIWCIEGWTLLNKMDRGSSCILQVKLNPRLFTVNVPLGDAVRLEEPGSQEALKCSLLPAFGVSPPGGRWLGQTAWAVQIVYQLQTPGKWAGWGSPRSSRDFRRGPAGTDDRREEASGWAGAVPESTSPCARED